MTLEISKLLRPLGGVMSYATSVLAFALLFSQPSRADEVWGADYFPNFELQAHTGETLRSYTDISTR